ncbi:MAG: 2-dehydropantoate 2-reductase, partial [Oceanospirillaceae bacterium]|nr:2-dehydropantoate 2-reductase [Oceanospirillaceae bacterium]
MTPGASLRITVAGAGAIGTALAARLGHGGHRVSVLARGATLQNLRTHGARLDDASGSVASPVTADSQPSFGHQDIVFLCCKSQDLPALAEQVAPLVGTGTLIVPAVNGVPFWGSRDFPSKNDKVLWRPRHLWPPEGYYFFRDPY